MEKKIIQKIEVNIEILLKKQSDITNLIEANYDFIDSEVINAISEFGNIAYELGRKDAKNHNNENN